MRRHAGGIGCGACARAFPQSTHPGGAGAPPGGQYGPPARSWLTDGRFPEMDRQTKSAARCRKENAAMARREAPVLSRGGTATKNNGCATWRAIPLVCRGVRGERKETGLPGASTNNTGDGAWADDWLFEK